MGLPAEKRRYTVKEYLDLEDAASEKHEFHNGEILAMAGTSPAHAAISVNLSSAVVTRLSGSPCRPYSGDLKVSIRRQNRYVYPDLSVVCGPLQHPPEDTRPVSIVNPKVIFEIVSPSTEQYDRGDKFAAYRELESLEEYVLVSQYAPTIETYRRQADGTWIFSVISGMDKAAPLKSLGIEIQLRDVFRDVEFTPAPPPPPPDVK